MSARDELVKIAAEHTCCSGLCAESQSTKTADAILAAGYSKPRTINTVEELDALHMVVVRSKGGSIANIVNGRAYVFGYEASVPASTLALPATVLYTPEAA